MHFEFSVSLGNVVTLIALMGVLYKLNRFADRMMVEHEILIADYCKREGIKVNELPTRVKGVL